jgi:hypothetical protein
MANTPGTSHGPVEYHWAIFGSSCPEKYWELNNSSVTFLKHVDFQGTASCTYTIGVQTLGRDRNGSYMSSAWNYFSFTEGLGLLFSITGAPLQLASNIAISRNYNSSGFTRISWTTPTQPRGFYNDHIEWTVVKAPVGDPMLAHAGGEYGNTMMLKLTPGSTYTLTLESVVNDGTGRLVGDTSANKGRVSITFAA